MPSKRSAPELSQENSSQRRKRQRAARESRQERALRRGGHPPQTRSPSRLICYLLQRVTARSLGRLAAHWCSRSCRDAAPAAVAAAAAPGRSALQDLDVNSLHRLQAGVARSAGAFACFLLAWWRVRIKNSRLCFPLAAPGDTTSYAAVASRATASVAPVQPAEIPLPVSVQGYNLPGTLSSLQQEAQAQLGLAIHRSLPPAGLAPAPLPRTLQPQTHSPRSMRGAWLI